MNRFERAREFRKFIRTRKRVLVQTHDYPDPDAIAGAFGLCRLIERYGGQSGVVYNGVISRAITSEMVNVLKIPIIPAAGIPADRKTEILVVDTRINNTNLTRLNARYIGEIDHHEINGKTPRGLFADLRPEYGSCSTIVGEYYKYLKVPMPTNVATALSIGLNTDTLRLLRNVSRYDVEGYYDLYLQSDKSFLQYALLNNTELSDLPVFNRAIEKLTVDKQSFMAYTDLGSMKNSTLTAIIGDFMLALKEVSVMLTVSWDRSSIYLSVRSESETLPADAVVQAVTAAGGSGGGHKSMAAGFVPIGEAGRVQDLKRIRELFFNLKGEAAEA